MKKCKKCGALQSDERSTCIDCGTVLGRPLPEAEEKLAEALLDDKLDSMAERTEDFYVPMHDKIMGILCIMGVIAAVFLLFLCSAEKKQIQDDIPEGVTVTQSAGAIVTMSSGDAPEYNFPSSRNRELSQAQVYALISMVTFIATGPMLFFPRFMWLLNTLKYRLFYNWDTTPSYFAIVMRKVCTYAIFAIGICSISYGYWLYL